MGVVGELTVCGEPTPKIETSVITTQSTATHAELFPGQEGRRFRVHDGSVIWWDAPSKQDKELVEDTLQRLGHKFTQHSMTWEAVQRDILGVNTKE